MSLIKSNILNWQEFDTYSIIGVKIKINYKLFDYFKKNKVDI